MQTHPDISLLQQFVARCQQTCYYLRIFWLCRDTTENQNFAHLCKQSPPRPVSQLQIIQTILLEDSDGTQLLCSLLVVLARQVTTAERLEDRDYFCQLRVAVFLKLRQHARAEKDLGLTDAVTVFVQFKMVQLLESEEAKCL